jgi:hypothetical protein
MHREVTCEAFMVIVVEKELLDLAHGLTVTQKILGAELSLRGTRHLIHSLFDHLISSS